MVEAGCSSRQLFLGVVDTDLARPGTATNLSDSFVRPVLEFSSRNRLHM